MDFKMYVNGLGIDDIISDLELIEEQADYYQKKAIATMVIAYKDALNGREESKPLEKVLHFTVDEKLNQNEKVNNVIKKHALVSMLLLIELSNHGKSEIKGWLSSVVVTTKLETNGDRYEGQTEINIFSEEEAPKENAEDRLKSINENLADIEEQVGLDIPLINRINGKNWLKENAPNNPKWSGYIGKKSLVGQLDRIAEFDSKRKEQTLTNISQTRTIMKNLNILISSHFQEVINGYREQLEIESIVRKSTVQGADEVAYYTDLIENKNIDSIASTGQEVTIEYFADSLFYKLAYENRKFLEQAQSFMLTIFITDCKHIKNDKEDRYTMTYHYDLKAEEA